MIDYVVATGTREADDRALRAVLGPVASFAPIRGVPGDTVIPIVTYTRVHLHGDVADSFEFRCPHCWVHGHARGVGDEAVATLHIHYQCRPQRAKPRRHTHGALPGHHGAHCYPGSPFEKSGYILRALLPGWPAVRRSPEVRT